MANGKGGAPLGNTNGARAKLFSMALRRLIAHDAADLPEGKRRITRAAAKLLNTAANGEEWAIKELANRIDGKSIQGVELAGPDGQGLNMFDAATLRGMNPDEIHQLQTLLKKASNLNPVEPE